MLSCAENVLSGTENMPLSTKNKYFNAKTYQQIRKRVTVMQCENALSGIENLFHNTVETCRQMENVLL